MAEKWSEIFGSEWEYICRLGKCFSDPEEKKAFWEMVKSKKLGDPAYSIYRDFPIAENATKKALRDCCDFVFGLRRPGKAVEAKAKERTEFTEMSKVFNELIDQGKHLPKPKEESA